MRSRASATSRWTCSGTTVRIRPTRTALRRSWPASAGRPRASDPASYCGCDLCRTVRRRRNVGAPTDGPSRRRVRNPNDAKADAESGRRRHGFALITPRFNATSAWTRSSHANDGALSRPRHRHGYLGFGVVGLVVVDEQQAPQQLPHAQAIGTPPRGWFPDCKTAYGWRLRSIDA